MGAVNKKGGGLGGRVGGGGGGGGGSVGVCFRKHDRAGGMVVKKRRKRGLYHNKNGYGFLKKKEPGKTRGVLGGERKKTRVLFCLVG